MKLPCLLICLVALVACEPQADVASSPTSAAPGEPRREDPSTVEARSQAHATRMTEACRAWEFATCDRLSRELRAACRAGETPACRHVARALIDGLAAPLIPDEPQARSAGMDMLDTACESGDLQACLHTAQRLRSGHPIGMDLPRAIRLTRRACDGGIVEACGGGRPRPPATWQPDPPDLADDPIAAGRRSYLQGDFESARALLARIGASDDDPRTAGFASAWLALANLHPIAEAAEDPMARAVDMSERTGDPELRVVVELALGAHAMALDEPDAAITHFMTALTLQPDGPNVALARVLAGEARINLAFGGEDRDAILHPESLAEAATLFAAAEHAIAAGDEMLAVHALEGLASTAAYKRDDEAACARVVQARALLTECGESPWWSERLGAIAEKASCDSRHSQASRPPPDPR